MSPVSIFYYLSSDQSTISCYNELDQTDCDHKHDKVIKTHVSILYDTILSWELDQLTLNLITLIMVTAILCLGKDPDHIGGAQWRPRY